MDFKNLFFILSFSLLTTACTITGAALSEGNFIGVPLKEISGLSTAFGCDAEQAVIFDETTRKIHVFRLNDMELVKSYSPSQPSAKHVVLGHENGNYVIDFSEKSLSIYSISGLVQKNPVRFQGQPLSAAFNSKLNLLVMYDDTNSVAFLKMNEQGIVLNQWVAGSQVLNGASITSGDLLDNGKLVLALSDHSIGIVDVEQTMIQQQWILEKFDSTLTETISWLAPVPDQPNQIFVQAQNQLAIFDVAAKSLVVRLTLTNQQLEKLSKSSHAHVVTRSTLTPDELTVYYPKSSSIQKRTLQKQASMLVSSHLNMSLNNWSFVEIKSNSYSSYDVTNNDIDLSKTGRTLKRFRLSDLLAQQKLTVDDKAQALISPQFLFLLYPSELGYAARVNILTEERTEAKFFNVSHIGKN